LDPEQTILDPEARILDPEQAHWIQSNPLDPEQNLDPEQVDPEPDLDPEQTTWIQSKSWIHKRYNLDPEQILNYKIN